MRCEEKHLTHTSPYHTYYVIKQNKILIKEKYYLTKAPLIPERHIVIRLDKRHIVECEIQRRTSRKERTRISCHMPLLHLDVIEV